jgi:dihydroorotase
MREIRNAVTPDGRTVCIRHVGGRIVSIGAETSDKNIFLDAKGLSVVPALNLMHVHFRVPGGEHKEDWEHGVDAAIHGGVATVGDMPNTKPPLTTYERFMEKIELIGNPGIRFWQG